MKKMEIARTGDELRLHCDAWRDLGYTIALVPTMGALHEGHMKLIETAKRRADVVIVSIFVNPLQFGKGEDFDRYPRDEEADLEKLRTAKADLAWLPRAEELYPPGFCTTVHVEGPARAGLEDAHRPGHFDGVATVVAKLFIASGCHLAPFGEKDYQQLLVVRRMTRDLGLPVEIVPVPTVREENGLALSSRNAYLSPERRETAALIYAELKRAAERLKQGVSAEAVAFDGRQALIDAGFEVDYFVVRNAETLRPVKDQRTEPLRILAAARLDDVRLIDNIPVT